MANLDEIYSERLNLLANPPANAPINEPALPEAGVQSGVSYTVDDATNQMVPVQEGNSDQAGQQGVASEFGDYVKGVATTVGDIPDMAIRGGSRGIVEMLYSGGILDDAQVESARKFIDASSGIAVEQGVNPIAAALGEGVAQMAPAALPVFKGLQAVGVGRIGASMVAEAVAGAFTFNPDDPNLANMAQGLDAVDQNELLQVVTKLMATDPADGNAINRLRNGIQDLGIGAAFELLLKVVPAAYAKAKGRMAEGKSPVPVGMSIEDVGDAVPVAMENIRMPRKAANRPTEREMAVVEQVATTPEQAQQAVDVIARIRSNYPTGTSKDKFVPIEVTGGKYDKKGVFIPAVKKIAYKFAAPKGTDPKKWRTKISTAMVNDVEKIVERAKAGDQAAVDILAEARWYRDMRVRLRAEFGGMGDIFADLLGTTSAQTDVKANWANAVEIIRRFSRGEFDTEIAAWNTRLASGESMSPVTLQQMHKAGEFPLITNASGSLFNANSPASMKALLDTFRDIKAGVAPKTPNFTGNLIGYSDAATVDVWAGRYLRNKSGQPYIPPPAEQAVGGTHGAGSTFDEPRITGDFGVGQDIFAEAARKLNKRGSVQAFNPAVEEIGADDLQAIVWFMEKEKWTKNGWTSKSGEGGSLDFEASVAGASDQGRMEALRSEATKTFKVPAKRKTESTEDYDLRVQDAMSQHIARTGNASSTVADEAAPLDRTILGLAGERPGKRPSNYEQAEMAAEIDDVLRNDQQVVAYKATNTYGNFAGVNERAIDGEIITRQGFDPTALEDRIVKLGKEKDQDAVFTSKVIQAGTPEQIAAANPGLEMYFVKKQSTDFAADLAEKLRQRGIDGFTFVTDARQADRIDVQAVAGGADTAGVTGIRVQYIPEFNSDHTPEAMQAASNVYYELVEEYSQKGYISSANVVHYETKVFRRDTDTDWMSGGTTYGEHTGTRPGNPGTASGQGQLRSQDATQPDRGTGQREISP